MTKSTQSIHEQRALRYGLIGVIGFVALALVFAVLTNSDAILFDGIYSLIAFCVTLLTIKVAKLAERPDDDLFHFGYTALEPLLNLFKALIILVACVYAGAEATKRLLEGGNPAAYGLAVLYGALASSGSLIVAALMFRAGRQSNSDLVNVEAKTWLMDGLLSCGVFLGFVGAWWLEHSDLSEYAPLVDPILLITIVALALPVPLGILNQSLREIIGMAPKETMVDEIEQRLRASLGELSYQDLEFRVTKRGRNTYLLVHVIVDDGFQVTSIADLDNIRKHSAKALKGWKPDIVMDMLFISDPDLAL
ncbi:MAG: cation diffusion facilitator family transporter [Pseudomonadota bacterium]